MTDPAPEPQSTSDTQGAPGGEESAETRSAGHSRGSYGPNPDERLRELEHQLQHDQLRNDHLTKQIQALNTDITDLKKTVDDFKKVIADYGKAHDGVVKDKRDLENYYRTKHNMVLCAVADYKDDLDQIIRDYDREIDEQKRKLEELTGRVASAGAEYQEAQKFLTDKQARYDYFKNYLAALQGRIQNLKDLKKQIDDQDANSKPASMYVLIMVFHAILEKARIYSKEEYEHDLNIAWAHLEDAKTAVRRTKAALDKAQADLDAGQKRLKTLEDNRTSELLKAVDDYNP